MSKRLLQAAIAIAIGSGTSVAIVKGGLAADHLDPPGRTDPDSGGMDRSADIADLFAWHTADSLVLALTYDGPSAPTVSQGLTCDRNVLYGMHISNDADADAEFDIWARYAKDDAGRCFVSIEGVPGAGGSLVTGPAERTLHAGSVIAFTGLRDDAFFFDLQGFRETFSTGSIKMIDDRDSFAGQNSAALILEFPLVAISPGGEDFRIWATTSRIGN
jgi:hypothetical protein